MKIQTLILTAMMVMGSLLPVQNASAWGRFPGGAHPAYNAHYAHPPVVVQRGGGCVGCGVGVGVVAGLVGGALVGAAIANSRPSYNTTIVEGPPPAYGAPIGAQVAALPAGCTVMNVNNAQYYQCGPTWYQPFFGGGGVYYTVVPTP